MIHAGPDSPTLGAISFAAGGVSSCLPCLSVESREREEWRDRVREGRLGKRERGGWVRETKWGGKRGQVRGGMREREGHTGVTGNGQTETDMHRQTETNVYRQTKTNMQRKTKVYR